MKLTMVIPSYWRRERDLGWREGDVIYDHPTPLDEKGILLRVLNSMEILRDQNFRVVVIAVANARDIEEKVEKRVKEIIKSASHTLEMEVSLFSHSHLRRIHDFFLDMGKKKYIDLLQLWGYSHIRNLCLFISHVLDSDVALLIDDDEVFEDPDFISKAKEFIGKHIEGRYIAGVAGYYLQPDGDYHVKKPYSPWMEYWNQYDCMNEAFDRIIGIGPRLKETPFVFGGNMLIHRNLFTTVPFDPNVPRGEDIDYLINARIFNFSFFLDNQLSIRHLAPPKPYPTWKILREDIYRFIYEREKIRCQKDIKGLKRVYPEDFDPYPGCFLKEDLDEKIYRSCEMLAIEYLSEGDREGCRESLNNIVLSRIEALPKFDPFQNLLALQRDWEEMMTHTRGISELRDMILEE
ncbi:MAG: hypothetical protein ACXQS7_03350 [Candidatus Syntropharchaeia archaeon]